MLRKASDCKQYFWRHIPVALNARSRLIWVGRTQHTLVRGIQRGPAQWASFAPLLQRPSSRLFSSGNHVPSISTTPTSAEVFAAESERVLSLVEDRLEADDLADHDLDCSAADGVVNITTQKGVWVINKHGHTRQIWLSSPISGPNKYNYHERPHQGQHWCGERDEHSLEQLLRREFSQTFAIKDFRFTESF